MINKWKSEPNETNPSPRSTGRGEGAPGPIPPQDSTPFPCLQLYLWFCAIQERFPSRLYSFQIFTITVFASFLQGHGLSRGPWHRQSSGIYRNDCLGGFHQDSGRCPARKHRWTSMFFESSRPLSSFPALASFLSPSPRRLLSLFSASPPTAPSVPFPHRCF